MKKDINYREEVIELRIFEPIFLLELCFFYNFAVDSKNLFVLTG